jgi:hypothetical protein
VTTTLPAPTTRTRPRLRPVRYEPLPGQAPARAAPATPPRPDRLTSGAREFVEAHRAATRILRLALEVFDGRRAAVQLAAHFTPRAMRYWRAATGQRTTRTRTRHGRIRLCLPRPGAAEVAATCQVDGAVRALAARFEREDGRWRCTAVRLI